MDRHFTIGEASRMLGVSIPTLRRWDKAGKLEPDVRTQGGHRRYSESALRRFLGKPLPVPRDARKVVLYARVARRAQRAELDEQVETLKRFCIGAGQPYDEIVTEVGSGLKRRPRLARLLRSALNGSVARVYVTHRHRLGRYSSDLIEEVLAGSGAELVVVDRSEPTDSVDEARDDLLALTRDLAGEVFGEGSREATDLVRALRTTLRDLEAGDGGD
jgi:putative resolvase